MHPRYEEDDMEIGIMMKKLEIPMEDAKGVDGLRTIPFIIHTFEMTIDYLRVGYSLC